MKKFLLTMATFFVAAVVADAVTFNVRVPDGTQKCYVCGSFNNWNADDPLELTSDGSNMFTLSAPDVTDVSDGYKYLCGRSWDYVEKDADGGEIENRTAIQNPDVVGSWRSVPEYGIETFELTVNSVPRLIKVYLPEGYDETSADFPVIYYNTVQQRYNNAGDDGDAGDYFFGNKSWNAHVSMETARRSGAPAYVMVQICSFVGENTPEANPDYLGTGNAAVYLDEFVNRLIPEISRRYRVSDTAVIAGADYGALFSLYAAMTHPEIFTTCVAMSPMLWINEGILESMASAATPEQVYYLSAGSAEPEWMIADSRGMADALKSAGTKSYFTVYQGATHDDAAWGMSLPYVLEAMTDGTAPRVGSDDEDDNDGNDFASKVFALYSGRNESAWSTSKKGLFEYTDDFYLSDKTEPVEAFVFVQSLGSTYTSDYYWNIALGEDSSYGWYFSSPKTIGFDSRHTTTSWQRVAVTADGQVHEMNAMYNAFSVKPGTGSSVKMTSALDDYTAVATVPFATSDKTFTIHYGSVNSGSDMGALTAVCSVSEKCTEAVVTFDFKLNKVSVVETKTDGTGGDTTPEPDFKNRTYTLYASDNASALQPVGTFVYTDDYYKTAATEPVSAQVITHDVAASYKDYYYWNVSTGDGWLLDAPKNIKFSSSHNTVSWLNIAIYEDGTTDNIAVHSQGFKVYDSKGNSLASMSQTSAHTTKATVQFPGSDKTFTIHYGSVNSSSDMGALTAPVTVGADCLEAEITYDFNLNKVTYVETAHGSAAERPKVTALTAVPAVAAAGKDVTVRISLNKACSPTVRYTRDFSGSVTAALVKDSDTEYHFDLTNTTAGLYTVTVSLTDGSTTVADAETINIRVLPADRQIENILLTVNAYDGIDWETTGRYKANFHTHTSQSFDTSIPTSTVVDRYKNAGYKILALTDHDANSYPWTMFDLYNSQAEPRDPASMGMLAIPANELSKDRRNNWSESTGGEFNHHNDFFTGRKGQEFMSLRESYAYTEALGGMQIINHPGQYWNIDTEYGAKAKNSPGWHAENFTMYSSLVGLEVYNQGNRRPNDRILWDQILSLTMPARPVWGYSCDDTHTDVQYFNNYQFMLMPELTVDALKDAMKAGSTVFSYEFNGTGDDKAPHVSAITHDKASHLITIDSDDADRIEWISSTHRTGSSASTTKSTVVGTGKTFDYTDFRGSYVRARLLNDYGETATQPFGFELETSTAIDPTGAASEPALALTHDKDMRVATLTCTEALVRVSVFNAAGVMVKYIESDGETSLAFPTADLAPGVYVVVAATPTAAYTAKFTTL